LRPVRLLGDGGDEYGGLDQFGRVAGQRWLHTAGGSLSGRFPYGYDRDSNVLYQRSGVDPSRGELYNDGQGHGYDGLNQLTGFQRGTLTGSNDGIDPATRKRAQTWALDATGNWARLQTTDGQGPTQTESRDHNRQNQVTQVRSPGVHNLGFDNNGNTTQDQAGQTYRYDAWDRLVQVNGGALAGYAYDALGRRVAEAHGGTTRDLYYSSDWQVLEERVGSNVQAQDVWSPVYVDALVLRDQSSNPRGGTLDQTLYVQQDANWDVTALVSAAGAPLERYQYDPYG
jgi:hypothetical protein